MYAYVKIYTRIYRYRKKKSIYGYKYIQVYKDIYTNIYSMTYIYI